MRKPRSLAQQLEHVPRSRNGVFDVLRRVRRAHEPGFIQRRRDVHTAVQQTVEQGVEARAVGGHDLGVVLRQFIEQEEAEHAALAVATQRHAFGRRGGRQAAHQRLRGGRQRFIKTRLLTTM